MADEIEIWKPVASDGGAFADRYEVSNLGRVRTIGTKFILNSGMDNNGYRFVLLRRPRPNVRARTLRVHAVVLESFVGPRPMDNVARHLNGDSVDNRLENLAWGTRAENAADAIRHDLGEPKNRFHPQKLNADLVRQIREQHRQGASHSDLAKAFGIARSTAGMICSGRAWAHVHADLIQQGAGERPRGEAHRKAKMDEARVTEIRLRHMRGESHRSLALAYGLCPATIHNICTGKRWKHVPLPDAA